LLNGTSALFKLLVPRIVEIKHMIHVKNDLNRQVVKNDLILTSSTSRYNVYVDIIDKHK